MSNKMTVVASTLKANKKVVGTQIGVDLPSVSISRFDMNGAAVMGVLSLPSTGQFEAMELVVNFRGLSSEQVELIKSGKIELELLFSQDSYSVQDGVMPEGCKIRANGHFVGMEGGSVVNGEALEGGTTFAVSRYEIYVDGKEILVIDQDQWIWRVNGKDQLAKVRSQVT